MFRILNSELRVHLYVDQALNPPGRPVHKVGVQLCRALSGTEKMYLGIGTGTLSKMYLGTGTVTAFPKVPPVLFSVLFRCFWAKFCCHTGKKVL